MSNQPIETPPETETQAGLVVGQPAAPGTELVARPATAVAAPDNEPVATGLSMKRRNPVAVWLGLPLVTLGIYFYVWYFKIHKEMAEFDRRRAVPTSGPMLVVLFLGWTVVAPLVSYHNTGVRIRNAQRAAGLTATCSPALSWLLTFAFGLNVLYLQAELNKVVDRYAGAPTGTTVPLFV